ncbi:NAD(P)/FAD-dependent oxidoreductase [Flavihumibacter solisilvae]|uniref:Flavoprotein n=1 Tax=Flavihumibacter solisilvae TaxID=1349421 RepID=A0A0C1IFL4_9BACT|nr:NAD(P)/FAD-dependent oxidoreductase [Flavihumibacter solisilvae]KIC92940.1 flavoprotein [Flavihumibacter solisilvae]
MQGKTLIIAGGGAAGFFCAVNAAEKNPGLKVIILEKSNKLLSKVRISGGGRCNVTHACFDRHQLVKRYPRGERFLKKSFVHFSPEETVSWFAKRGVQLKTEEDGRMFPVSDDSGTIISCLLDAATRRGVQVLLHQEVKKLSRIGELWQVDCGSENYKADFVCIACGGYPKPAMFQWLTELGHTAASPVPSLFTFNIGDKILNNLMGISIPDAQVKIMGSKLMERGPVLVTHWGLSGPAVLRLSAWGARELAALNWHFKVQTNWIPEYNENSLRSFLQQFRFEKAAMKVVNRNPFSLPQRFWEYHLEIAGINAETRWSDLPSKEQNRLIKNLCAQEFEVKGKTTFKEEFVTAGGINLAEVDPDTMESRLNKNLFFAGEVLDVDGVTGGFNFQHAWTSGFVAALAISTRLTERPVKA